MKKAYFTPTVEVVRIDTHSILAGSEQMKVDSGSDTTDQLARPSTWLDDEE